MDGESTEVPSFFDCGFIDGIREPKPGLGGASFANHSYFTQPLRASRANAVMYTFKGTPCLLAFRDVAPGEEIHGRFVDPLGHRDQVVLRGHRL